MRLNTQMESHCFMRIYKLCTNQAQLFSSLLLSPKFLCEVLIQSYSQSSAQNSQGKGIPHCDLICMWMRWPNPLTIWVHKKWNLCIFLWHLAFRYTIKWNPVGEEIKNKKTLHYCVGELFDVFLPMEPNGDHKIISRSTGPEKSKSGVPPPAHLLSSAPGKTQPSPQRRWRWPAVPLS